MPSLNQQKPQKNLQETFRQIVHLLEKQSLVSALIRRQDDMPRHHLVQSLLTRQHLTELQVKLDTLHPADIAFVLESLPLEQRRQLWQLIRPQRHGAVLLEVSDAVRSGLLAEMEHNQILGVTEHMDSDKIADLMPDLPKDTVFELLSVMDSRDRAQVQSVLSFPENSVGALMDFDMVTVREDVTLDVVLRYLRRLGQLPDGMDKLFVVDKLGTLKGVLPLRHLLIHPPDSLVKALMVADPVFFHTDDPALEATRAFERYDLITAPVINMHHQLVGSLGVDAVVDFINETAHKERLGQVGLKEEEDMFAPLWQSARNRWLWLALNLITALIASRVIGVFEETIEKLVALAALMPIVASVGGNTGNQTLALIIRELALSRIHVSNLRYLLFKELGISLLNGALWGSVMALIAFIFYQQAALSLVMLIAMMLNLMIAALAGVLIPIILKKLKRDPVMGSSVILTALTDSMGFFIFLGLASVMLL